MRHLGITLCVALAILPLYHPEAVADPGDRYDNTLAKDFIMDAPWRVIDETTTIPVTIILKDCDDDDIRELHWIRCWDVTSGSTLLWDHDFDDETIGNDAIRVELLDLHHDRDRGTLEPAGRHAPDAREPRLLAGRRDRAEGQRLLPGRHLQLHREPLPARARGSRRLPVAEWMVRRRHALPHDVHEQHRRVRRAPACRRHDGQGDGAALAHDDRPLLRPRRDRRRLVLLRRPLTGSTRSRTRPASTPSTATTPPSAQRGTCSAPRSRCWIPRTSVSAAAVELNQASVDGDQYDKTLHSLV